MRTFIALEVSPEIQETLGQAIAHFKYAGADVKWVKNENIHLTVKFLGEVTQKRVDEVKTVLDRAVKGISPFDIRLQGFGAFPTLDSPRVIWAGLEDGTEGLKKVVGNIEEGLTTIGFEKESRPFTAHLTIGRVRSQKNRASLKEKLVSYDHPAVAPHRVASVTLFQSTLTPSGSIYTRLHDARLGS